MESGGGALEEEASGLKGEAMAMEAWECRGCPRPLCVCHLGASEAAEIEGTLSWPAPSAVRIRIKGKCEKSNTGLRFLRKMWEGGGQICLSHLSICSPALKNYIIDLKIRAK